MKKLLHWILVHRLGVALALLLFFLLNILASLSDGRLDLTEEKRYTLEEATRQQLQALNEPIEVTVFLKGEFPSGFKKLATSTDQFLSLLQKQNPSRFHYRFVSPLEEVSEGKLWGDSLLSMGALNINLTVQKEAGQSSNILFPVALVEYRGQQSLVTLLPGASRAISQTELNRAEALLEFHPSQNQSIRQKYIHWLSKNPRIRFAYHFLRNQRFLGFERRMCSQLSHPFERPYNHLWQETQLHRGMCQY